MRLWILQLLLIIPSLSHGQTVVYDNSTSITGLTTYTYSITVGANSNRALVVFIHIGSWCGITQPTVSSVTANGVSLTQVVSRSNAGCTGGTSDLWALPAGTQPATGANTIEITLSGPMVNGGTLLSGAISAYNVDQTTLFTSTGSNAGAGTSATLTLGSSGANDLVLQSTCNGASLSSTPQTSRWQVNFDARNSCYNHGGATAAGGTTSLSWTGGNDNWIILGGSLKAATASTATFDTSAHISTSGVSAAVLSFTVGSGGNRGLAVFTHASGGCGAVQPTVASVTYAGVNLTRTLTTTNTGCTGGNSDLWTMPANTEPASGANTLKINMNSGTADAFHAGVISASNVDPINHFTSSASNFGNSTSATLTLPSSGANDLVVNSVCNGTGITSTPQTQRWRNNRTANTSCDNAGGATAAGGTTSLSWTVSNDFWIMIGASFKAATKIKRKVIMTGD